MQQMAPQFIENYGFHDDEFTDGEDTLQYVYASCLSHSRICVYSPCIILQRFCYMMQVVQWLALSQRPNRVVVFLLSTFELLNKCCMGYVL